MNRLSFLLLALLPLLGSAAPAPAPVFCDGAVLQQGCNIPIWGRAEPGEHITVSFRDQKIGTTTDPEGNWQVLLAPIAADSTESELCIQGTTTVTLRHLLVGDVWLFVGTTALHSQLLQEEDASTQIASATLPLLRFLDLSDADAPGTTPTGLTPWHGFSPDSAGRFSSEAFFFARQLHRKTALPLGIIKVSSKSGPLATWLSPAAINSTPSLSFILQRWQEAQSSHPAKIQAYQLALNEWKKGEQKARDAGPAKLAAFQQRKLQPSEPRLHRPAANFEALLHPLQAYALRGLVYHETEFTGMNAQEYESALRAFISTTRAHFGNPLLPVLLVQLGPQYAPQDPREDNWALFRQAQASAATLPNAFLITSLDLGSNRAVHPYKAQDLARRLSQTALATVYNIDSEYKGPTVRSVSFEKGKLRLDFEHASTGLIAYKKPVQSLELAGADGRFFPATASIHGSSLLLSCPQVSSPKSVRYAWDKAPYANLANGAGIPAAPFHLSDLQGLSQTPPETKHP